MNKNANSEIIGCVNEMTVLLQKCSELTNRLLICDLENTDELDTIIEQRGENIELLTRKRAELDKLSFALPQSEQKLFATMISGGFGVNGISDDMKKLQSAVINMRSVHMDVIEKDKKSNARVSARYAELRDKLESLKQDKKKIDFYSNMKYKKTGGTFDSHS